MFFQPDQVAFVSWYQRRCYDTNATWTDDDVLEAEKDAGREQGPSRLSERDCWTIWGRDVTKTDSWKKARWPTQKCSACFFLLPSKCQNYCDVEMKLKSDTHNVSGSRLKQSGSSYREDYLACGQIQMIQNIIDSFHFWVNCSFRISVSVFHSSLAFNRSYHWRLSSPSGKLASSRHRRTKETRS